MFHSRKNKYTSTLQFKSMLILSAAYLPLIVLLLFVTFTSAAILKKKSYESESQLIRYYMQNLDDRLENLEEYLKSYTTSNSAIQAMAFSNVYPEQYEMYKYLAYQELVTAAAAYESIDYMYIYDSVEQKCHLAGKMEKEYRIREELSQSLCALFESGGRLPGDWFCLEDGQAYLMRNIKYGSTNIGILLKAENCINLQNYFTEESNVLLCDEEGNYVESLFPIQGERLKAGALLEDEWIEIGSTRYLKFYAESRMGSFYLVGMIPSEEVYANVFKLYLVSSLLIMSGLLLLPVCVILMRREILRPIHALTNTISTIAEGEVTVRAQTQSNMAKEFQIIYESFNHMMNEMEILQEELLEKQKREQRLELLQLQYQIRPHFFLNCLNGIYGLAETGQDALIQEMVLNLSHYFRYIFRADRSFVRTTEECKYVSSYADIRKLLQKEFLTVTVKLEEEAKESVIPPFTIMTFVENSFKHGAIANRHLHIWVEVRKKESNCLEITILDDGKGFSKDVLEELAAHSLKMNEKGEHAGISNVCERLRYSYREPVSVSFENREEGGSAVRLVIPFCREGEVENVSDIAGR